MIANGNWKEGSVVRSAFCKTMKTRSQHPNKKLGGHSLKYAYTAKISEENQACQLSTKLKL